MATEAELLELETVVAEKAVLRRSLDALAESHAGLMAALGDLADCVWFKQTTSAEVDRALAALAKARALVPEEE